METQHLSLVMPDLVIIQEMQLWINSMLRPFAASEVLTSRRKNTAPPKEQLVSPLGFHVE